MDALVPVRLILAVALAISAVRRALDRRASRGLLTASGVPAPIAGPATWALAMIEAAVAVALMFGATAWWAAIVASGHLVVAALLTARRIARRGAGPAELSNAVRTTVLAVPATLVIWLGAADAGPDVVTWIAHLSAGQLLAIEGVALVLAAVAWFARAGATGAVPSAGNGPPAEGDPAPVDRRPTAAALVRRPPQLTIGMATYDDFDGVYFTVQALRLYHDLDDTELLVVDNFGCPHTRDLVRGWVGGTYVLATDVVGTAAAKDQVFRSASGTAVLCCDSHVLFAPGAVARLKRFHREHPDCLDLLQGPLVYDDGVLVSTHFDPVWRDQMWGTWATDPRGGEPDGEPFDIPMQGLGAFSCRTEAWPGFAPGLRGFGGEEGYIHEKFRRAGRRCLCLPWLRWMHRFTRPRGVPYPLTVEDKFRNYLLGHADLGLDLDPVIAHFTQFLPEDRVVELVDRTVNR
jgi:hypothetical protein